MSEAINALQEIMDKAQAENEKKDIRVMSSFCPGVDMI